MGARTGKEYIEGIEKTEHRSLDSRGESGRRYDTSCL